jgi:hypothetical protein
MSLYGLIEKEILYRMSAISMDHTHDINDLLGQLVTFWTSKHVGDVSHYSTNIEN